MHGQMLGAAVVPESSRSVSPSKSAGELRPMAVLQQILQQRSALRFRPALEADGVGAVDEQQLAAGFRVRAYHRMEADRFAPVSILAHLGRSLRVHPGLR